MTGGVRDEIREASDAWRDGPSDAPRPPVYRPLPLSRSLVDAVGGACAFFVDNYRRMGPVYRFTRNGKEFTVLAGTDANRFIALHGRKYLSAREFRAEQNLELDVDKHIVGMDGPAHTAFRRLQKRGYSKPVLHDRLDTITEIARSQALAWPLSEPVDVMAEIRRIVARQLGLVVNAHPDDYLDDLVTFIQTMVVETVAQIRPKDEIYGAPYLKAKQRSLDFADDILDGHRESGPRDHGDDLIDDLLRALADDDVMLTEQELRVAALGPYIGGMDTVASTCAFVLYALLRHPDVLAQATQEADAILSAGPLDSSTLKEMRVLHAVAIETMRLYPVSPAIQGTAAQPFEFAGYRVEQGDTLVIAATVPHFLSELYPDPLRFDITRHREPRHEYRQPGAYAPFGIGPHICLGAGIAEVLIALTVANVIHALKLEIDPPDYQLRIVRMPTPAPADFRVRVLAQR